MRSCMSTAAHRSMSRHQLQEVDMDSADLCYTPALELRRLIQTRALSPLELAKVVLERIERLNPVINAFLTIPADLALQQAKAAEARVMRGSPAGPLDGIPYSVKDLEPTAGVRTTYGSKWFEHNIPAEDGAVAGGSGGPAEFSSAKRTRPT